MGVENYYYICIVTQNLCNVINRKDRVGKGLPFMAIYVKGYGTRDITSEEVRKGTKL